MVRFDGSRRVTLRNRKFLRKYVPVQLQPRRLSIDSDLALRLPAATTENPTGHSITPAVTPTHATRSTPAATNTGIPTHSAPHPTASPSKVTPSSSETPSRGNLLQSRRQLAYTEPPSPDSRPVDVSVDTGPSRETPNCTTPPTDLLCLPVRRSGRTRTAPEWQKDYVM